MIFITYIFTLVAKSLSIMHGCVCAIRCFVLKLLTLCTRYMWHLNNIINNSINLTVTSTAIAFMKMNLGRLYAELNTLNRYAEELICLIHGFCVEPRPMANVVFIRVSDVEYVRILQLVDAINKITNTMIVNLYGALDAMHYETLDLFRNSLPVEK